VIAYSIVRDDLSGPEVAVLLRLHLDEMHRWSPACKVHALPLERLREPDVTFFSAWDGERLAAVGALKDLGNARGELKSMRAAPEYRGKGAGEAILLHLMDQARSRGYSWLGLETGRPEPFVPARRLYEKHGFAECPPFGDYVSDVFSLCMSRTL
jgi:putative acetyltransferase